MKVIWTILKREYKAYFSTPIAVVFLLTFLVLANGAMFFQSSFFTMNEASLRALFYWLPYILAIFVPAVGMRAWSEERRQQTLELLLTMPVRMREAVLGKFLAGILFLMTALFFTLPLCVTAYCLGSPDSGVILCSYLGALLLCAVMLACCMFLSALTTNQVISYILGAVICLLMVVSGHQSAAMLLKRWMGDGAARAAIQMVSIQPRVEFFQRGIIDCADVVFLLSLTIVFLMATAACLQFYRGK